MQIRNTTKRDLGLSPEHIVPAGGVLDIDPDLMEELGKSPVVQAWAKEGWIKPAEVKEEADDGADPKLTPEAIAEMDKDALFSLLEKHGVSPAKNTGVDTLRETAVKTVFPEE